MPKELKIVLVSLICLFCIFWTTLFAVGIKYVDKWTYEEILTYISVGEYIEAQGEIDSFIRLYPNSEYLDKVLELKPSVDEKAAAEKAAAEKAAAEKAAAEKAAAEKAAAEKAAAEKAAAEKAAAEKAAAKKAAAEKASSEKATKQPTTQKQTTTKELQPEELYELGTPLNVGDLIVTIVSVSEKSKIYSNNQFIDDITTEGKFIVMDIRFTNNDDKPRTIDSALLKIVDSQGREYNALNNYNLRVVLGDKDIYLEEINPGMSLTGTFVFEIQKNINEYYIRISPGFISFKPSVTVKLK